MLFIVYTDETSETQHVPLSVPSAVSKIKYIQADGHELEAIRAIWAAMIPAGRVVKLYGCIAQTMMGNAKGAM